MKAKFSLLAYVSGKRVTIPIKKGAASPPQGATRFYLRYTDEFGKRHDDSLGTDFALALAEVLSLEARTEYERKTGQKLPAVPQPQKKTLTDQIKDWLELKKITPGTAPNTIKTYTRTMKHFLAFAETRGAIHFAADMTREEMFRFSVYLRAERKKNGRPRFKPLSIYSHFANVMIFLKAQNIHLAIPKKQWGKPAPRKAQKYTTEELDALFLHASEEESLLFKSFFYSGMRNQELGYLTYADIDFKTSIWTVQPKQDWETKSDDSVRWIPVPAFHTEDIRERMARSAAKPTDFVFPNSKGTRHQNYVQLLKKVARHAGITGRVDIHKFRSTCATTWLRDGIDILEVARRLGHGNLGTIRQYVEMMDKEDPKMMERTDKSFERWNTRRVA